MGGGSDYEGPTAEEQAEQKRLKDEEETQRKKAEADRIFGARSKYTSGGGVPSRQPNSLLGG